MKKVVLISTGQPSTNPRLVKEADALQNAGYEVTVLYSSFINWADSTDKELLSGVRWKHKLVGGSPSQQQNVYWFTRLRFKLTGILLKYFGMKFSLAERSQARAYDELLREGKGIKADWYIGHNLGALPVAVKAAKFNSAKAGFDFEDYHRGENVIKGIDYDRKVYLENKYVPELGYFSGASDMITAITKKNHPNFGGVFTTIYNCFPASQQPPLRTEMVNSKLSLFWFSQTVGFKRGLEEVIEALKILDDPLIQLTIAGRIDVYFKRYVDGLDDCTKKRIHFAGIVQPGLLPVFASKFDVGLALETGFSENNKMALSNKVFTYLLAGNAVIFSETDMQLDFNKKYHAGESFPVNNINALVEKIASYKNEAKLNLQRTHNFNLAKESLNWEMESKKLLDIIK